MALLDACRGALLALVAGLALDARAQVPAIEPPAAGSARAVGIDAAESGDPQSLYRRALDLEREHDWSGAIQVYQDALDQWPGRVEFRHRLRLCETHYKLGRRYQDRSFREVLLPLSRDQALSLYDEVLERIQLHYVEPVAIDPILRRGFDNLEVALRDPVFIRTHAGGVAPERLKWLREMLLRYRQQLQVADRTQARSLLLNVCDQVRSAAGIPASAVILEFAYGACDALDEYSAYLSPDRLDDLYSMIDGNFVGLGVELKLDPAGGLLLVNVLRGGPAFEAGLTPGDRIVEVDGQPLEHMDLDGAANRLQGPEGTSVRIVVRRSDGSSREYSLTRRPVEVESVAMAKIVDREAGIGYVQLIGFQKTSTAELQTAIAKLEREGMRYLVLDLRGNPGGLLNVSVEIAERFLEKGVIVSTRGRAAGQSQVYRASGRTLWRMPMTVLIDHDSASASEILAGALQDNHRAMVLGVQSYGKGSVQSIFPLRTVPAGLKLTTAKFYSPDDRPYSEQGVVPNTVIRTAARPAGEAEPLPSLSFGSPESDPVLRAAVEAARRGGLRRAG